MSESYETLATRLETIRSRVAAAAERAGRDPSDVTLVAVSKTFSAEAVAAAQRAGITDFGENRVQELTAKADAVSSLVPEGQLRWHMIGHLQRNKAREVVRIASLFHALDSLRLARELDRWAERSERVLRCLIQVNTSGEETKEGVAPAAVTGLLDQLRRVPRIEVRGFMTVAAPVDDPEEVRHEFRALRALRDRCREAHPDLALDFLSMGMSGDYEVAIEEGATHVRIGRLIFGSRPA